MKASSYPFVPKSTASLRRGQFWAIPLQDGSFGAGCVVGRCIDDASGKVSSRYFIAAVLNWHGSGEPTASQLEGVSPVSCAFAHIKAITTSGKFILGEANTVLHGLPEEARSLSMSTWGYGVPTLLAAKLASGQDKAAKSSFDYSG